jgi:hypothetical protein
MENKVKMSKTTEIIDLNPELSTRKKLADSVIMNAKEIISTGLRGKETKKIIALVPVSLLRVDHKSYQREEKKHVIKMSKEWDDTQCTLLLVNYRNEEGWFYVIDGQHRTVAAKILGIEYLPCEIFIGLSVEEEAKRFLYYNTGTKSLNPFDTFKANICWGEPNDTAIKEVCDKYGIDVIDRKNSAKSLRSVSVARAIYKSGGTSALNWIFSLIEAGHWEDFKESYSADILIGFNAVYNKNSGNLTKVRENLLAFMKTGNPTEVAGFANMEYPTLGHSTRIRLVIEDAAKDTGKKIITKKSEIA